MYEVMPRYTPGSPGSVRSELARKIADEEAQAIRYALEGLWGPIEQARAQTYGLRGIVQVRRIYANGRMLVSDMLTGESFGVPKCDVDLVRDCAMTREQATRLMDQCSKNVYGAEIVAREVFDATGRLIWAVFLTAPWQDGVLVRDPRTNRWIDRREAKWLLGGFPVVYARDPEVEVA